MEKHNGPVAPALERLGRDIPLLHGAVSGLESILRRAEELDDEGVKAALPFLGLVWLYSSAIRDLLHAKRQDGSLLWNAPALAALARPLQDALLSLVYFAIEKPDAEEAEFRQLLLSRHVAYKRWDLLRRADQTNEAIARECASATTEWEAVNEVVLVHPYMRRLPTEAAKRLAKNGDHYILDPLDAVWQRAGLPHELYDVTFRYLSQYAHATPYAVANLRFHQADHEDGAVNMAVPTQLAVMCVVKALDYAGDLHPELHALLPPAFHEFVGS
jgi:hypothetical protein